MDLASATEELYAGLPQNFVARRKELAREARAAKDRPLAVAIEALRRPSRGAWLVNLLARQAADSLRELFELAPLLAQMHTTGSPEQLRELGGLRRRTVIALVQRAVELGGAHGYLATDAVRWEVQVTLEAALGHPEAAEQVLAGCLVQTPETAASFPLELFTELPEARRLGVVGTASAPADGAPADETSAAGEPTGGNSEGLAPVIDLRSAVQDKAARAHAAALRRAEKELARVRRELDGAELAQRRADQLREQAEAQTLAAQQRVEQLTGQAEAVAAERAELEARLAALVEQADELARQVGQAEALAHQLADAEQQAVASQQEQREVRDGVAARLTELADALEALQAEQP